MSRTERITSATRAVFRMMSEISYSGFTELAPTVTPLAPAFFFAAAIATTATGKLPGLPQWIAFGIAFLVGFFAAYGLESSAFMSFGSAMKAHRHFGRRALLLPAAYLAIGITALWAVEEFTTAVIGTALFLLAAVVYASRMVMIEAAARDKAVKVAEQQTAVQQAQAEADRKQQEREDREWQRQQEVVQAQRDHELAMARLESERQERIAQAEAKARLNAEKAKQQAAVKLAQERVKLEQIRSEQPQSVAEQPQERTIERVECEDCGQVFGTVNALNAHGRWCSGKQEQKAAANGRAHGGNE